MTQDALGRLSQVEELNWDTSVYATTAYTYNALDQLTQINQSGQLRTLGYDGHGRLATKTTPEQGATSYTYNADDTVHSVTDARGASQSFTYNNRQMTTGIAYGVPSGVAATPNIGFSYDGAGNRTTMTARVIRRIITINSRGSLPRRAASTAWAATRFLMPTILRAS
ncbi:MAG: hypothetical protein ABR577_02065 [Pyrinomonadaceae bacterium]